MQEKSCNRLYYDKEAEYWDEALPIGNGRLGAMIYGTVFKEKLQLNEESLWSGGPRDRVNPDCRKNLDKIRKLYREGKISQAQQLAVFAMSGMPQRQRMYQTLGELEINQLGGGREYTDYERILDLDKSLVTVSYRSGNTLYHREYFASYPADCIVIHLSARGEERMNFSCRLERSKYLDHTACLDDRTLTHGGDQSGILYEGGLRVLFCDGETEGIGAYLIVKEASEVVMLFTAATSFRCERPRQRVLDILDEICGRQPDVKTLYKEHLQDYRRLFGRVELTFPKDGKEALCTDRRMEAFARGGQDPGLVALYFQYGRYLMISGSREGGLPLTLQGIWNEEFTPPWDSKYTININLEMNYWPVDVCGLPECSEPFFSLLRRVCESGRGTAERMYGCRGFVAHHNTDIFADTAPQDLYVPASYWVMGGAWLSLHIWEHYRFTMDEGFLADHYEVLKNAVLFFEDFLEENEKGELVTLPSVSPENRYVFHGEKVCMCEMPAMDVEILTELFRAYIAAAGILGKDEKMVSRAEAMLEKLPPIRIGSDGRILEWNGEFQEADPGHRHMSHLFGLFPGSSITVEDTPDLAEAAEKSLRYRLSHGGGHTGWSRAWIILFWARLKNGELSYENLRALIADSTFTNLMDTHPSGGRKRGRVFQIDGNMGAITGIAEMLVQSHNGRIQLLPALPPQLAEGSVRGLCMRGGAKVEMVWKDHRLLEAVLEAGADWDGELVYGKIRRRLHLKAGSRVRFNAELLETEAKGV